MVRIGAIIGPLIAGALRGAGAAPGTVFLAMAPVAGVAALAVLGLGWRTRR